MNRISHNNILNEEEHNRVYRCEIIDKLKGTEWNESDFFDENEKLIENNMLSEDVMITESEYFEDEPILSEMEMGDKNKITATESMLSPEATQFLKTQLIKLKDQDVNNKHTEHNIKKKAEEPVHLTKYDIEPIDISNILINAIMNNKIIFLSAIPLFAGYYLQDTIFTRSIAGVTSDIPGFVKDIDIKKLLIFLLPYIMALVLFYISSVVTSKAMTKIELDSLQELTDKLIESIKTTKRPVNVNELMSHIKKVAGTKNVYSLIVTYIIPTFIVAIGLIYTFSQNHGPYSMLVALIIIILMLVTTKLEFDSISHAYATEDSSNVLYDEIHEIMSNMDSIITSDTKDTEIKNVLTLKDKTYNLACRSQFSNSITTYGLQMFSIVSMLGINYIAYRLYMQGVMNIPAFTSTVLLSMLLMDYYNYSIHAISDLITSMGRYYETREYFLDYTIVTKTDDEKLREIALDVKDGTLVFKDLTVKYENKVIFDNFNYVIKGGTITGLIGPIGSGKTTLLKILAGILEYEGEISIDNQDLKKCSYESIVEHIAYIPQHPKLFNRSVYYNINYGSCYKKSEIMKRLKELGLIPFVKSLANGLDTVAGKEGSKLSGGQRQLVYLIRAIVQNKSIFLLDEPSSSLDTTNKQILINLIKNMKTKTILISTHDNQLMKLFDNVIIMDKKSQYEKKNNSN